MRLKQRTGPGLNPSAGGASASTEGFPVGEPGNSGSSGALTEHGLTGHMGGRKRLVVGNSVDCSWSCVSAVACP